MYNNGVSHKTEPRDLDGIYTILKWLSYIPKVRKEHNIFNENKASEVAQPVQWLGYVGLHDICQCAVPGNNKYCLFL